METETTKAINKLIIEITKLPETKISPEMVVAISELVKALNQY
ncbi:hypothetical protein ACOV5J_05660 [Weissella soli]